ncbi:MAG: hypothetical protein HC906_06595 [Bacteroidales bacterium]|nr:hypothetical protein [Bacteroidales bacterium]
MHKGDTGKKLIHPGKDGLSRKLQKQDQSKVKGFVPIHHIFGSEELSSVSSPVKELSPIEPFAAINENGLKKFTVKEGESVIVVTNNHEYTLKIKRIPGLPDDLIYIPFGLSNFFFDFKDSFMKIRKTNE